MDGKTTEKKSDALARAEALESEAAKLRAENGIEPFLKFPDFGGVQGGYHYDKASRTFWVGFDVTKMDYQGAKDFLRSADFQVWNLYREIMRQIQGRQMLAPKAEDRGGIAGLAAKLGLAR